MPQLTLRDARRLYRSLEASIGRRIFAPGEIRETEQQVLLSEFGLDHEQRNRYEPSRWFDLRRGLRGYRVRTNDVFADIGCGKGRIVHLAARMPFRRVIGVEIAPELAAVAQRNVEVNRERFVCADVRIHAADATLFPIPDDLTVVYMYNPFGPDVLRTVMANICASLERAPRPFTIIYANPLQEHVIAEFDAFRRTVLRRGLRRNIRSRWIAVYRNRASLAADHAP